ncbi:MAG: hypothetical protein QOH23_1322 [Gaiellaceae bacterium]|jgi:hypothetical protein|nr:hypothetical protein [Gaiellaceae bacterium]
MLRRLIFAAICCVSLAAPVSAKADDNACGLFTTSTLFGQILGGDNHQIVRDLTAKSGKDNTSGVLHSVCNGYVWLGAKPKTRAAALAALRAGTGSAFAVDTWEPDDQSPYADKWANKGFPRLVKGSVSKLPNLPGLARLNVRSFKPNAFGIGAKGFLANPLPGVAAGGALWWKASEAEVAFVSIGAGARRPLVREINQLAGLIVGAFGMT